MNRYMREPINGITHLAGAILSFIALLSMTIKVASDNASIIAMMAVIVFGISLILLYATSATYHLVISSEGVIKFLRRLDHSMIFVLIAGSYTPFCLIALNNLSGWILFTLICVFALCGIVFKMAWFNCPHWLSTAIYIVMGWLAIFLVQPLTASLSVAGTSLLVGGGVLYTIGGIIYGIKPNFIKNKYLGYHEIFHIFILLGSLLHFLCIYLFVI
ncbi:MAG TPA: hemolysin [Firmicutes bacterium]|nr:hemolysin [Bacillota bacterium]